ncbi:MAG: S8 family serine peptidase [Ardenticatenaceae bacterium]|nr:S8 family serine peptidase [Ardenticatenaceae bacterium]
MKQKIVYRTFSLLLIVIVLLTSTVWLLSKVNTADQATMHSYIVQGNSAAEVAALVEAYGGEVTSELSLINGVGALLPAEAVSRLSADPDVTQITPNAAVQAAVQQTSDVIPANQPTADFADVIGADFVWSESGNTITGEGITVAVVDSGIDSQLPSLNKDANNNDRLNLGMVFLTETMTLTNRIFDDNGHGTHIAGIIGSSQVGDDGEWNGVAPNVDIISIQVLGEEGWGTYENVIRGIQWVVAHKETYNIRVMNLSLVATPQSPYWADPMNQAVMQAWAEGIVVVAAAGNGGPLPMTVGVPGNNPYVITVGAFTDNFTPDDWSDDYITPFSAAGPTLDGFVKPDVIAPGAHMLSTMKQQTHLAMEHPDYVRSGGTHFEMAGTSQGTAVVSGLAALILSNPDNADLTPDQVKYRIMHTSLLWTDPETGDPLYSVWQQGVGRVNAPDAVFTDTLEVSNYGMDILCDLDPESSPTCPEPPHYEGFSYYDPEMGLFYLYDAPESWASGYSTWAGGYSTWAGGYSTWAGGYSTWAGGYSTWAGGYSTWAGGYSTWAGGYSTWAGGYTGWIETPGLQQTMAAAAQYPWPAIYNDPDFISSFQQGLPPADDTPVIWDEWVEEIDWTLKSVYLPFIMN